MNLKSFVTDSYNLEHFIFILQRFPLINNLILFNLNLRGLTDSQPLNLSR